MKTYKVIGLMSGTSLDGVDIAYCIFTEKNGVWKYNIEIAETCGYSEDWKDTLTIESYKSPLKLLIFHKLYGSYLGSLVTEFILKHKISPDFIASHGHTLFHQPKSKLTFQLGDGAEIAAKSGLIVVCDFRSTDVALGGQGAPLVPVGDKYLFNNYNYRLNLGGIANISFEMKGKILAFDVCPSNIPLNSIATKFKKTYDDNGKIAASGKLDYTLLKKLNKLEYFSLKAPKSLGKEWVNKSFMRIVDKSGIPDNDKMRTICEHIAMQISAASPYKKGETMLVTGGGAYNTFLMERIKALCPAKIVIPDNKTVEFKEALIFAFLGVLRMRGEINCLSSVTGARNDSVGGAVYLGSK